MCKFAQLYACHELFLKYKIYLYELQKQAEQRAFGELFRPVSQRVPMNLYLTTMYVFCVYPAMSKKSENLSDLDKKDRNNRHSSPFINVVKGVFFVVRVTLVPVSYILVCALRCTKLRSTSIRLSRIAEQQLELNSRKMCYALHCIRTMSIIPRRKKVKRKR